MDSPPLHLLRRPFSFRKFLDCLELVVGAGTATDELFGFLGVFGAAFDEVLIQGLLLGRVGGTVEHHLLVGEEGRASLVG